MVRFVQWPGLDELLAQLPISEAAKAAVVTMMSGEARRYHGVEHVTALWRRHKASADRAGFASPRAHRLIACSIAFHDCIYDGYRHDNEERSALSWLETSRDADISEEDRTWIADTIRQTKDHLSYPPSDRSVPDPDEPLRLWMLDLDLTPIGEPPEAFDRNALLLRQEVPDLEDAAYEKGVRGFLERLAAAPQIYRSPDLAAIYEAPARRNLARRLGGS